ncbi:fumarylacetoacetase [Natronoglycomyces albus]|uniref:fumarylacetoacetase n=1 Tax=Natronoglycomyces albus TaxID=2811108 RepID=A0A895XS41_9ACTN|nr:fumarylacetoacetase [Natronoglycomyces albus]QSB05080.1 fumarylacetoacetase [Natronoglycomyces albus]
MTWVDAAEGGFGVHHLPYGAFSTTDDTSVRLGVRIGDHVLDLRKLAANGLVDTAVAAALSTETLNAFMSLGRSAWDATRSRLQEILTDATFQTDVSPLLTPVGDVSLHMPFDPADYVDFYSSEHHATNVGRMFRPDGDALMPNWKHIPIGYHGRSGTLIPSGSDIVRPTGQRRTPDGDIIFGASVRLDIEAEVGFVVGVPSQRGQRVSVDDFADVVFGTVLVNDWSARDIQAWEYQPLGPFLGKSFATSIGSWVTPLAALSAAQVPAPTQDPQVQPYLAEANRYAYDLSISVEWNGTTVANPPFASMYWTPAQQLAHLTVNGASVRSGDFYASGTVSGPEKEQRGSFLELSWAGKEPVKLDDGSTRTFLEDGDTVVLKATAPGPDGSVIELGEVSGTIKPALS